MSNFTVAQKAYQVVKKRKKLTPGHETSIHCYWGVGLAYKHFTQLNMQSAVSNGGISMQFFQQLSSQGLMLLKRDDELR